MRYIRERRKESPSLSFPIQATHETHSIHPLPDLDLVSEEERDISPLQGSSVVTLFSGLVVWVFGDIKESLYGLCIKTRQLLIDLLY